jgi:hypothetical protein
LRAEDFQLLERVGLVLVAAYEFRDRPRRRQAPWPLAPSVELKRCRWGARGVVAHITDGLQGVDFRIAFFVH